MLVDTEPLVGELNVPTVVVETGDYRKLVFKPSVNGVELDGDKTTEELGIIIPDVSKYVEDANYVHTDNNYTNDDKQKLISLHNYDDTALQNQVNGIEETVGELDKDISNMSNDIEELENTKADKNEIPDVSEFIKKNVSDLVNYYNKSETYTQNEVNQLIGAIKTISMKVVPERPATGENNVIYLVPSKTSQTENVYDEYIYISNKWELIGSTAVDLSNYYNKGEITTLLYDYITSNDLEETLENYATKNDLSSKQDTLTKTDKDNIVKDGLVNNGNQLSDEEKLKVETWLGLADTYLTMTNTTPYQVNADYVPAHKKYVDNKINEILGDLDTQLQALDTGDIFIEECQHDYIYNKRIVTHDINDYCEYDEYKCSKCGKIINTNFREHAPEEESDGVETLVYCVSCDETLYEGTLEEYLASKGGK